MLALYESTASAHSLDEHAGAAAGPRRGRAPSRRSRASSRPSGAAAEGRFGIDFDPTLVRGMGYYTGPVFEMRSASFPTGSIAGGGRYDGMIGRLLGKDVPATGFSIGFERVVDILGRLERRAARDGAADRVLFDEAAQEPGRAVRGGAGRSGPRGTWWRSSARRGTPGAQRAALEKQGYDGVATVTAEGRASIQWFADRAQRQPGSGA